MIPRNRLVLSLATTLMVLWMPSLASAETMAGLQIDIGDDVDAVIRDDLEAEISRGFDDASGWSYMAATKARAKMNPVVRDCFTVDCLTNAGASLDAPAGLRLQLTGEAQIYDWTLEIYDLRSGEKLNTRKGACELCGRQEVVRTFGKSLRGLLGETSLPKQGQAAAPAPTPPPVAGGETADDRQAGLVTVEIDVEPADTRILLDGQQVGVGDSTLQVAPGEHELRFAHEGHRDLIERLDVAPGTKKTMSLRVHLAKTTAPAEVVAAEPGGLVGRLDGEDRRLYGLIGAAGGASLLATGIILAAFDGEPACDGGGVADCPDIYDTGAAAMTTAIIGTTLVTGGLTLLAWDLLAGGDEATEQADLRVAPTLSGEGAGLGVWGRF